MNMDAFLKYVARTRDCDAMLLDIAVGKGLNRAKNCRPNQRNHIKLVRLAAAVAVSAALCAIMYTEPFIDAVSALLRGGSLVTQSDAETLGLYISDFFGAVIEHMGR
jgi:hypothetical protein